MIIVMPFHSGDIHLARLWMQHVRSMGSNPNHSIILMPAKGLQDYQDIQETAAQAFGKVDILLDAEGVTGHPEGPNSMMRQIIWHMQMNSLGPWTFMEPDCIPLIPEWLDQWEREYRAFGKPFMGELRPAHDVTPDYLTGNMVLPLNALFEAPMLSRKGLSKDGVELAFDIVAASQTLPKAHLTKLIQQVPKQENGDGHNFPDEASLSIIRPGAVLFHPCKDGSLIDRLAGKKELTKSVERILATPPPEPPIDFRDEELTYLRNRVKQLEELLKERPGQPVKQAPSIPPAAKGKRLRTAAEQKKINERMAKARAARATK